MKAAICTRYGPPEVLQLRDVATPAPGRAEVLVRIHATTVTASDCLIRSGIPSAPLSRRLMLRTVVGVRRPRRPVPGAVLAGTIQQTGYAVSRFRAGDRVWAFTLLRLGCYAQYTCLAEGSRLLGVAPTNLTDEECAAIPYGGLLALHFLNKGRIRTRRRVLVYGGSGAIGTAAIQLAKHYGAEVTAVCSSRNVGLVRSLGADAVIDYTTERTLGGDRFDLVLDAVGRRKVSELKLACRDALTATGQYISVDDGMPRVRAEDLALLAQLAEARELEPVIDRLYPLEQIVEAHRYVEQGHKRGNVVIRVDHGEVQKEPGFRPPILEA